MKKINTTISLVIFNLIPLVGVMFFSWNIFSIILIYWLENIVIGFYNILKMWKAEGLISADKGIKINGKPFTGLLPGPGTILFFIVHFGMFTLAHGVFVFAVFSDGDVNLYAIVVSVIGLFISHGFSYYSNFIGKEEYKKVSRMKVMFMPYPRVVILHLVIMFSGFFIIFFNFSAVAIIPLVGLKIVVDVLSHKMEHNKIGILNK